MIAEGKAKLDIQLEKPSRKMGVFYNQVMAFNRTMSVMLLNVLGRQNLRIALPMAGSGVRAIRFLKELEKGIVGELLVNDISPSAVESIKENLALNGLKCPDAIIKDVSTRDASAFLTENRFFDYIDIDPFGSPNPFLDAAIRSLKTVRSGILAVTATDTAPLSGTYPDACRRKYWAVPIRNEHKHEIGLRILIRKIQLVAAQYEIALEPLVSYSKDHYFRIYFESKKSKKSVDLELKNHLMFNYWPESAKFSISEKPEKGCQTAGPLYAARINSPTILKKILDQTTQVPTPLADKKFIQLLYDESKIDIVGFWDVHTLAKLNNLKEIPSHKTIAARLGNHPYAISHTIPTGIKTEHPDFPSMLKSAK